MDTATLSPSGGWIGIGFAVPSDLIRHVVARLEFQARRRGDIRSPSSRAARQLAPANRAELGISLAPLASRMRGLFGVRQHVAGAVVEDVKSGSLADIAGLQPGDVIVGIDTRADGSPTQTAHALISALNGTRHAVAVRIIRNGHAMFLGIDERQHG